MTWNIDYQVMATTGVVGIIKGKNSRIKLLHSCRYGCFADYGTK